LKKTGLSILSDIIDCHITRILIGYYCIFNLFLLGFTTFLYSLYNFLMIIRPEKTKDYTAIHEINELAFGGRTEADLIEALGFRGLPAPGI